MAKNASNFSAKDRIQHTVFGTGTIVEVGPRYTVIAFDEEGTRKFLTEMVQLKASDTPAPAKPARKKKTTKKAAAKKTTKKKAAAKKE